ncbi:MAG TPA: hypothetical protein VK509_23120, partial [Polyangiales bacterium]|nr:hypothetical protein [Polyangiales bacterium]
MSSRPWIVACLALLGFACGLAGACSGDRPQVGGETHWLRACDVGDPCGDGLQCICGSCTHACSGDDACDGGRPAACYDMSSPLLLQRCAGSVSERSSGVCLPSCTSAAHCAGAQSCEQSACVPDDSIGVDAGAVFGGYAGEIGAQGTTIDDFTDVTVPMSWSDEVQLPVLSTTIDGADAARLVGVWTARDCDRSLPDGVGPEGYLTACPQLVIEMDERGVVSGVLQFLTDVSPASLPPVADP